MSWKCCSYAHALFLHGLFTTTNSYPKYFSRVMPEAVAVRDDTVAKTDTGKIYSLSDYLIVNVLHQKNKTIIVIPAAAKLAHEN